MADEHRFETCGDSDCPRLTCLAYRAGFEDGYAQGCRDTEATAGGDS